MVLYDCKMRLVVALTSCLNVIQMLEPSGQGRKTNQFGRSPAIRRISQYAEIIECTTAWRAQVNIEGLFFSLCKRRVATNVLE